MVLIAYYLIYLTLSISFTYWVGKNLHRNGRIFLMDSFHQDSSKADAVNQLLLVGFYLVNFGMVTLFLNVGEKPKTEIEVFEFLAGKIGWVLVVLGGMHFFNMRNIARMRSKAIKKNDSVELATTSL